ncbi:MAG: CHASE2 domain-containing protein [Candidatus Symbiothrix sp.]|jgi:hypothetical protein|nr:CHASE2 domain-containing protein [Candidatus Symbiothrix sp.]
MKKKYYVFTIVHSLVLVAICYSLWNLPFTLSDESGFIRKFYAVKKGLSGMQHPVSDDVLLVNVAYDKQLIDYYDERGLPAGKIDITDRSKLLELFSFLSKDTIYQYIVCDVFFDSSLKSAADDSLFALIATMPRIVVPMHEKGKPLPENIRHKAAYADYTTNIIEDALLKYQFLQHGQPSIPLFIWQEQTGGSFKKQWWGGYTMHNAPATNSAILDFTAEMPDEYNEEGYKNFINLGADLLELIRLNETQTLFKNKIILIGDLTEYDIHSTTDGQMPGVLINYNAYRMLNDRRLIVPFGLWILLFAFFCVMTILSFKKLGDLIKWKVIRNSEVIRFILSLIGFSVILLGFSILCYYFCGRFVEIFLWSGYFALLEIIINLYKLIKNGKKN